MGGRSSFDVGSDWRAAVDGVEQTEKIDVKLES